MTGPWEDYQPPQANPWDEYAAAPVPAQGNALSGAARALEANLPFVDRAVAAAKTYLPESLGGVYPTFSSLITGQGTDYASNLAAEKAKNAAFAEQNPWTNAAGGLAAYAPAALIPVGAASLLGRALAGGVVGGGLGTVQGASNSLDLTNLPETGKDAGLGLAGGATLGAAFPAVSTGIGAAYNAIAKPEMNMLAAALHGISPAEMASAQALMQDAANRGIRLTSAEAIQQATGGETDLGRLQRIVEGTKGGASVMAPFMAARPEQVQNAVADALNRIAPPPPIGRPLPGDVGPLPAGIAQTPGMTGAAGQKAATDALMAAERARTNAVTPLYEVAGKNTVPANSEGIPPRETLNGARLTIDEAPAYISSDNVLNVRKIGNDEPDVFSDTPRMTRTYNIDDDAGRDHGMINLNYDSEQKNIRVLSMEVRNLADGLSRENAQRILDQVHRDYPEAETISGMRITGSRSETRPDTKIRLRPLSLTAPATRPQVPSGNMTDFLDSLATQAAQDKTGIVGPKLLQLRNDLLESKGSPAVPASRAPILGPDRQVIRYETTPGIDAVPPKPLTDLESLDRVRKYHRDILDLPQIGQDAITKEQNAAVSNALGRLNDLMEANSKPFVAAKQKFQDITARDVAPLASGPLGKLAASPELRTQTNALFPTQPSEGAPQEIARAIAALNQQDPNIAAQLARQHLASNFAERAQQNIPGENQWGGAKFAAHITGNPLQADVLNQGLGALPHGATVAPDVNALLEALRATGKRQAPGSLTAQNTLDLKDLSAPGAIGTALHAAHSPVSAIPAIIAQLGDAATRARLYGHSAALARALTADPVGAFNAIAATRPVQRPVSRASMAAALAANADLQAQRNQAIGP